MCGIVGWFDPQNEARPQKQLLRQMCDVIAHRGPDDEGVFVSDGVALGMRRLSIIDLATGHQPMQTEDSALTVVFNGEIYNHLDVRADLEAKGHRFRTASDTEVVLRAYREWGPASLGRLNGMFAIALWDASRSELFLARDRMGVKPLYLTQCGSRLAFASEVKALLLDPAVSRNLDREALHYFLRYGYVTSPATLFEAVRQLPPGHFLVASPHGLKRERYWTVAYCDDITQSDEAYADTTRDVVERAVRRQLISDVPLGAFLSGGLDSSSVVAFMRTAAQSGHVATYSIGFTGADTFHNELEDAQFVSNHFRTDHHEILVEPDAATLIPKLVHHLDQPLADSSFIVTYLVSALARETVKVIISGVGGDEVFGGYRRYLGPRLGELYDGVPGAFRRSMTWLATRLPVDRGSAIKNYLRLGRTFLTTHGLEPFEQYDRTVQMLSPQAAVDLCPAASTAASPLVDERRRVFHEVATADPVTRMLHLDLHTSLVDSLLLLTDKMSMAASLEARVPFLDHEVIEAAARIPTRLKVRGLALRYVQKQSMHGVLPPRVLQKKKRGFGCPVGAWFRGNLAPLLQDHLSWDALKRRGLFNPASVQSIVSDHAACRQDHTDLLLALLTFQIWQDEWRVS